ncbi:MAG TPA: phosphate ABC transporter substrate-binding protein PstS [Acidimicrobiales bacterium]|nr:phosphate ABC transporter substrate-binding protein PstS [Acidimicrobiales bacterium]
MATALIAAACTGAGEPRASERGNAAAVAGADDRARITGAGSTFAGSLIAEWITAYGRLAPGVDIRYEGTGSPGGVQSLVRGEVDFAVSDVPLSDDDVEALTDRGPPTQIPWVAGAIAIHYNLPGVEDLKLSPEVLAGIFSGRVSRWDDPLLRADNRDSALPGTEIQVVHRSDPSGTTQVLGEFLQSSAGPSWPLGVAPTLNWPGGIGARGSDGVAASVKRTVGAIGYADLASTEQSGLGVASVRNADGRFVPPTAETVGAALDVATLDEETLTFRLYFGPGVPRAYPISTFSYLVFRPGSVDAGEERALRHFAAWALSEGQRMAPIVGYAVVPLLFAIKALDRVQGFEDPDQARSPS